MVSREASARHHILLWATQQPERLSPAAQRLLEHPENTLHFSVISLWEVGVKRTLNHPDFRFDPRVLRESLLDHGYLELVVSAEHALAIDALPPLHRDPFDRFLLCQALVEGLTLVTNDRLVTQYPVPAFRV